MTRLAIYPGRPSEGWDEPVALAGDRGAIGIRVGFAALTDSDTVDSLTVRADAAMLEVKTRHKRRAIAVLDAGGS